MTLSSPFVCPNWSVSGCWESQPKKARLNKARSSKTKRVGSEVVLNIKSDDGGAGLSREVVAIGGEALPEAIAQNLAKDGKGAKSAHEQKGQKGLEDLHLSRNGYRRREKSVCACMCCAVLWDCNGQDGTQKTNGTV